MKLKKYILYLIKDNRTNDFYYQVVGNCWLPKKVGTYIDLAVDLPDNPKEKVLCLVRNVKYNVIELEIVKEVI